MHSMQQWWGVVTTSRLNQLCLKPKSIPVFTLAWQPTFALHSFFAYILGVIFLWFYLVFW
jgi:hypothetical protein